MKVADFMAFLHCPISHILKEALEIENVSMYVYLSIKQMKCYVYHLFEYIWNCL